MLCPSCRQKMAPPVYRAGPLMLDMGKSELRIERRKVNVPRQVLMLLQLLMENVGRTVSRQRIWHAISEDSQPHIVSVVFCKLRVVLGEHAGMVRSIPRVGLILEEGPRAAYYRAYHQRPEVKERQRLHEARRREKRRLQQECSP